MEIKGKVGKFTVVHLTETQQKKIKIKIKNRQTSVKGLNKTESMRDFMDKKGVGLMMMDRYHQCLE